MDLILPHPTSAPAESFLAQRSRIAGGTGDVKVAFTARDDIARFVVRIIADPRTLNQTVFCYGDEVTLNEVYDAANKVSGEDLKSTITFVSIYMLTCLHIRFSPFFFFLAKQGRTRAQSSGHQRSLRQRTHPPYIRKSTHIRMFSLHVRPW